MSRPKRLFNVEHDVTDRGVQCGAFDWRPAALQKFATMKSFTAAISLWTLFINIHFSYYTGVMTNIEKSFGLSSTMAGLIKNVDNIGYVIAVIIVAQLCRYANKPRLFATATAFNAIAVGMMTIPYFIYGSPNLMESNPTNTTLSNICYLDPRKVEEVNYLRHLQCSGDDTGTTLYNGGAAAIFIVSTLLQGAAGCPKFSMTLTYMDDNDSKKSPLYFGTFTYKKTRNKYYIP